ncbi:outer membrane beta-barrel protein [Fulvivirga sediminis]|uniref:Outer membrane beta-barrel protein n=1 Tax=Fulvivirga sediminis TaxID=2803949 RepID=A0A937F1H5_9BACT|nr:outer membrane beta-barrel protein [Fulvivirga sediminis]MBL3654546.1 outer membrane beta-barrel protein [Fulvivirga sediminis]
MDDNKFDEYIRNKVESYKDTHQDEGALAAFRARMDGVHYVPWYVRYKDFMRVAASVVLISLLNFGLYSFYHNQDNDELREALASLRQNIDENEKLKTELSYWQNQAQSTAVLTSDTVYIEKEIIKHVPVYAMSQGSMGRNQNKILLGTDSEISDELKSFLTRYSLASADAHGNIYLNYSNEINPSSVSRKGAYLPVYQGFHSSRIAMVDPGSTEVNMDRNNRHKTSIAKMRELEKHRMKGVGFQYGPQIGVHKLGVDKGSGNVGAMAGIDAEFIFSPAIRLETGARYVHNSYVVNDIGSLGNDLFNYPAVDQDIGELTRIKTQSNILAFPIHLKYNLPLSENRYLFVSSGISPMLYLNQKFKYIYAYSYDKGGEDDFRVEIEASKFYEKQAMFLGTVDAALGVEKILKNKSHLLVSLFYQHGISTLGNEERNINMLGLQTALRFRVK